MDGFFFLQFYLFVVTHIRGKGIVVQGLEKSWKLSYYLFYLCSWQTGHFISQLSDHNIFVSLPHSREPSHHLNFLSSCRAHLQHFYPLGIHAQSSLFSHFISHSVFYLQGPKSSVLLVQIYFISLAYCKPLLELLNII